MILSISKPPCVAAHQIGVCVMLCTQLILDRKEKTHCVLWLQREPLPKFHLHNSSTETCFKTWTLMHVWYHIMITPKGVQWKNSSHHRVKTTAWSLLAASSHVWCRMFHHRGIPPNGAYCMCTWIWNSEFTVECGRQLCQGLRGFLIFETLRHPLALAHKAIVLFANMWPLET